MRAGVGNVGIVGIARHVRSVGIVGLRACAHARSPASFVVVRRTQSNSGVTSLEPCEGGPQLACVSSSEGGSSRARALRLRVLRGRRADDLLDFVDEIVRQARLGDDDVTARAFGAL